MILILMSVCLGVFATAVMCYVSIATPIGPWIGPTLLLCSLPMLYFFYDKRRLQTGVIYSSIAGSIGGIVATGFGFTVPTLYFLDPEQFKMLIAQPVSFCLFAGLISFIAGWYGILIANVTQEYMLGQEHLPFPIAQLMYKIVVAQSRMKQGFALLRGFLGTLLFCAVQDGWLASLHIPKVLMLSGRMYYGVAAQTVVFDIWPLLWAIGFVTGRIIVVPLVLGILSLFALHILKLFLFTGLDYAAFILAFGSGIVLSGVCLMFMSVVRALKAWSLNFEHDYEFAKQVKRSSRAYIYEGAIWLVTFVLLFSYMGFSLLELLYLMVGAGVCACLIITIAGEIGLAQLGRFATFVLVPALFFFKLDALRITVITLFVEVCSGVAVDALVGRKLILLHNDDLALGKKYQYLGLVVSSMIIGIIFLILVTQFQLGSAEFFAQRGQARALLINMQQLDYVALALGICYGLLLRACRINAMLVLGGLLMPINISIGLIVGAMLSYIVRNSERFIPFWSGVFAGNSLWMIVRHLVWPSFSG